MKGSLGDLRGADSIAQQYSHPLPHVVSQNALKQNVIVVMYCYLGAFNNL